MLNRRETHEQDTQCLHYFSIVVPIVLTTQYDVAGRLTLRVLGNNILRTSMTYFDWSATNGQGRVQFIQTGTAANPISLQKLEYNYDVVGNIDWIKDWKAASPQLQDFGYDNLYRLTNAVASGGTGGTYANETYTYDNSTGNLASKAGTAYTYGTQSSQCANPALNQPHAVTSAGSTLFCYDANGNQVKKIAGSTTNYAYDGENRMVSVTGAATATFVYDGDGNRVKGVAGGVTTTYIGNSFEWTGSTSTMKKYYYAGGTRVAERVGTTLYWLLGDHLGSTSITATSSGSKTAELRYKPWGETRYTSGTTQTTIRYTGQREESSLGLYWYASRWYSPSLARFLTADTLVPQPGSAVAYDRYAYANNNPVCYSDPSGHRPCDSTDSCTPSKPWSTQQLKTFASNLFTWKFSGNVSGNQVKNIIIAGNLIKSHIDRSSSNQGVDWIHANLGSTTFTKNADTVAMANTLGANAYVWPYNTVNLGAAEVKPQTVVHELGHVLDNNKTPGLIPATVFGGGPADDMVRAMGGHPWLNPLRMQYGNVNLSLQQPFVSFPMNKAGYFQYIAGNDPWPIGDYANHGVSDDFAQTFVYTILNVSSPKGKRTSWMESYLQGSQ